MDCICFNRRRRRKESQRNKSKDTGLKNLAYNHDGEEEDKQKTNSEQTDASHSVTSATDNHVSGDTNEGHSSDQPAQVENIISVHSTPSDKAIDVGGPLIATLPGATQDDLCLSDYNLDCYDVDLMTKDPVGPGFSVTGTLTDGIVVGSIHEKGPAAQTGQIAVGDRIISVTIGFDNMAYEDALTILSYASPYPLTLRLARSVDAPARSALGTPSELNEMNSRIYHPVYRSQSVGGGTSHSSKHRKMPPRPGTSLSQVDYKMQEAHNESGESTPPGTLVKGKFTNTLNLIEVSDSPLLNTSDTTTDSSLRSESRVEDAKYDETAEEVVTTFCAPLQAVAGSSVEVTPVEAEVMITEPPTQTKLAILSTPDTLQLDTVFPSTGEGHESSQSNSTVTTPTSPNQIPPEKPKRVHQLKAEGQFAAKTAEEKSSTVQNIPVQQTVGVVLSQTDDIEEKIIPQSKVTETFAYPDGFESEDVVKEDVEKEAATPLARVDVEDVQTKDHIPAESLPVEEPLIVPTQKVNEESSNIEFAWNEDSIKPSTLTVDTVKIKDNEELSLECHSARDLGQVGEQPSPNDSGIHSEKAPSEQDDPISPAEASSNTSSPKLYRAMSNSSDDIMSAVLSLSASKEKAASQESLDSNASTQSSTPRSTSSITPKVISPLEQTIPKATTRSQLEAARTRFFAELMQTSDLFKDSPSSRLSFSSDSLSNETTPVDPSNKQETVVTNNNNLTSSAEISSTTMATTQQNST